MGVEHNNGYIFIKAPKWWRGKIYSKMYCFEHHYVYYINTGIYPKEDEVIHHKNGNVKDNEFQNLELISRSKHSWLHKRETLWAVLICPWCGKIYKKHYYDIIKHKKYHRALYCSRSCKGKMTWDGRPEGISFETCYITKILTREGG